MIEHPWLVTALLIGAYAVGTIPSGLILAKARGIDIRELGSGNIGATNVSRVLGRRAGALVLAIDLAKGAAVSLLVLSSFSGETRDWIWLAAGCCCLLGNVAPAYLGFRGGKGVATALGVVLGIYPILTFPGLVTILIWGILFKTTRYVSLASIVAALSLPLVVVLSGLVLDAPPGRHLLALCVIVSAVIVIKHRANIGRLMAGTENRSGVRHVE